MSISLLVSRSILTVLQCLIKANPSIDWRMVVLDDQGTLNAMKWNNQEPTVMTPLLKAYQRLVYILPEGHEYHALALLESGFNSAVQVAGTPRDEFARRWEALFPGEGALGRTVHDAAVRRRGELVLHHIDRIQHNEPHYRAARFK